MATTFCKGDTDIEEFVANLRAKFGSVTRAWRVGLDADESGLLDFREFCIALKHIGYTGNIKTLWYNLDDDNSGSISLKELDPKAAGLLEKFRALCTTKYGSIENMWNTLLDQDKSGTVSMHEFTENVKCLGYVDDDEVHDLFMLLLVQPGSRFITLGDITFLQNWEDTKRAQLYRKRLGTNWVNKDPFLHGPADLGSQTLSSNWSSLDPADLAEVVGVDPEQEKEDFRKFLVERYGSLCNAFDVMDANMSGSLSLVEFQSVVATVLRYCRPAAASRLFMSFNEDPGAMLTWDELGILPIEWINHGVRKKHKKRLQLAEVARNAAAPVGSSPRQKHAVRRHMTRVKEVKPTADLAFSMPLARGWGCPPDFRPNTPRKLPPLSAR